MLRGLRKASSNWVGKTIMGAVVAFLIGSFAIWGIGDIFRGFGLSTAAKVGRTEITTEQFRQIYNDKLQEIGRQIGRTISSDQARALGFDRQILAQLTAEIALDERARVAAPCASRTPRSRAGSPPSRASRPRPVRLTRSASSRPSARPATPSSVSSPSSGATRCAASSRAPSWAARWCRRPPSRRWTAIRTSSARPNMSCSDHARAGDVPAPTPEALAEYFNQRKILFRAPEFRKIEVLTLIPSEQASWIEVSDDDIKHAYEDAPRQLRHAGEAADPADRVPERRGRARRRRAHRRRHQLRRHRQGARLCRQGHRARHPDQEPA